MDKIFPFKYMIDYDKTNPQNQIILWKIENYNSYLTDFSANIDQNYIQFKTQIEDIKIENKVETRNSKKNNLNKNTNID